MTDDSFGCEHHLAALADPRAYPHHPPRVEVLQTHLSVVCLADNLVYKLKKARRLPFVDCSTLAARRRLCREEVRLNRRLCPTVYLGTAALRRAPDGKLRFAALGDDDQPDDLDVAVVMQRLPQDRMLDQLVAQGLATTADLAALGRLVAEFHARAERGPAVTRCGAPHQLATLAADNVHALREAPPLALDLALLAAVANRSAAIFPRLLPELERRAARGNVVDGHGDLHMRNICLCTPPAIYDCLEFAPELRCGDVATENAFLVMDLRHRQAPHLAEAYLAAYAAASGDLPQRAVLPWLCAYRAMVRAKVAALAHLEVELPADARAGAARSAVQHVELAAALLLEADAPRWLAVTGPPATGKTTLCRTLAQRFGWPHHNTDALRKRLAGVPPEQAAPAAYYQEPWHQRTYAALAEAATAASRAGASVVLLDGNFATAAQRTALRQAAAAAGARLAFVVLDLPVEIAITRAAQRQPGADQPSDAGPTHAAQLHRAFEPPDHTEPDCARLAADRPLPDLAAAFLAAVLALPGR